MTANEDERATEDALDPSAESDSWLAEQIRLLSQEDGFA
jgi:hypothetical protein